MRRMLVLALVAGLLSAGCARAEPRESPAGDWPAGVKEAEVYEQVLRRYLGTPSENSFPGPAFATVYVLDQAFPDAGDPNAKQQNGTPIIPETQRLITDALQPMAHVTFIA